MNSSSFEGVVLDPSKCSMLTMEEKRELVYELSKWSHGAPEMLQSWSRQEILSILCAEMGKERKYTGLTKLKIIENLLKIVSEKKSQGHDTATNLDPQSSPAVGQRVSKRQRKTDHPNRLPGVVNNVLINNGESDIGNTIYCKNAACKAKLSQEYTFCKRCSCCICCQYDDNKDPSLWLTCCSEPPFQGDSCGMSCHLECALRHEKSGIAKNGMDGSFFCVSCGKVNDLLGCWRKQLITAKDTRRVDILCYRVSLSQKLLAGTKCYQKLYEIMDEAVKKLEADVGPLTGLPVKRARGIVNRLSLGPEVQRLCAFAVESLDLMLSKTVFHVSSNHVIQGQLYSLALCSYTSSDGFSIDKVLTLCNKRNGQTCAGSNLQALPECFYCSETKCGVAGCPVSLLYWLALEPSAPGKSMRLVGYGKSNLTASNIIRFEDVCTSSLTVILGSEDPPLKNVAGYNLWHRKVEDMDYPAEPTCTLFTPNTRFLLSCLNPATEYVFKIVCFDSTRELGTYEVQFQTCSAGDEVPNLKNLVVERRESPPSNSCSLSNPSSVEDETNNIPPCINENENENENENDNSPTYCKNTDKIVSANLSYDVFHSAGTQGGTLGDSASLLDEEGTMEKISSIPNSDVLNLENKYSPEGQTIEETSTDNGSNTHVQTGMNCVPFLGSSEADLPITPCKLENIKDGLGRNARCKPSNKDVDSGSGREEDPQAGSSSKKSGERREEENSGIGNRDFEYYVKVIRWLECEGHIETTFRQKFLTWYSLRATPQEVRVVKVFVDTLIDDPASLAGQLVDTFSEAISSKRSFVVPSGFCLKLWH